MHSLFMFERNKKAWRLGGVIGHGNETAYRWLTQAADGNGIRLAAVPIAEPVNLIPITSAHTRAEMEKVGICGDMLEIAVTWVEELQMRDMAQKEMPKRRVYVASMNMRGKWAERPPGVLTVNVTSAQPKTSVFRIDFSPMSLKPYKGFVCFENYWQAGKVFEGIDHVESVAWWKKQMKGKRRYPRGKGRRVLHADFGGGKSLQYVESRKQVYVPCYDELMRSTPSFDSLLQSDEDICICDFDGPREKDGTPICLEVTQDLLRAKLHDETFPFGHGYVVAAGICGWNVEDWV